MNALPAFAAAILFAAAPACADYALGLGQKPLYPAGFTHFAYADPAAPKGGTFAMPLPGSFDTLNPFTLKGTPESGVSLLTLDTLMAEGGDDPFAMYGLIARDAAVAPDGLSVTFTLNPAARFHNGDPVLAADAAESFRLLTRDAAASPMWKLYWADVAAVETPAPRVLVFRFKRKNAELPLILGQLPVFSRKSYPQGLEKGGGQAPIGSGPYRLAKTESGRLAVFARDKNYWAQNLPARRGMYNFDTVRLHYVRDNAVLAEGVKAGRYDFSQETSARAWARAYPEAALQKRGLAKAELPHSNTAGMQGFVMNQRRAALADIRVRRALILSFDFENVNNRMMYNAYHRSPSFFTNSPMAAAGLPDAAETALLAPLKQHLPEAVFTQPVPVPPKSDPALGVRPNLLAARALLLQAGYRYRNGVLTNAKGEPLVLEFLIGNKLFERVIAKWQRDLAKIGITLNARTVDASVYQKRLDNFDFDLTTAVYGQSQSPGNEQAGYFSCAAAKTPGSRNLAGLCHPAVEALLPRFGRTADRAELTTAARALDRVLRHQYIIVPNWYTDRHRVIRRAALGVPARPPKYYTPAAWALQTWWAKVK